MDIVVDGVIIHKEILTLKGLIKLNRLNLGDYKLRVTGSRKPKNYCADSWNV